MPVLVPPAVQAISGAVLPKISYVDLSNNPQTLLFQRPPRQFAPLAPSPVGSDTVASDGTLWTTSWYVEVYLQFVVTVFLGADLTNWINFLTAAVNGQVMTFQPNQADGSVTAQVRLMVQGRSSNNSGAGNIPSGDPTPKPVGPGRFEVAVVLRLEDPTQANAVYEKAVGLT